MQDSIQNIDVIFIFATLNVVLKDSWYNAVTLIEMEYIMTGFISNSITNRYRLFKDVLSVNTLLRYSNKQIPKLGICDKKIQR